MEHDNYDYFYISEDPDELFQMAHGYFAEVQNKLSTVQLGHSAACKEHTTSAAILALFGSNKIEYAGLPLDITTRMCHEIREGTVGLCDIESRCDEIETALRGLIRRRHEDEDAALSRSCKEVVQHALPLQHITTNMLNNETLSEELIKSTHRILTEGIDGPEGDDFTTYSGIYRTVAVTAAFNHFTTPEQVPSEMRRVVKNFEDDVEKAETEGRLDPFALSSKYCHQFVNIHSFIHGNGRLCRLILNAILLKYAGIFVQLCEGEGDREEYLEIAASMDEQVPEDERSRAAWGGLAAYILKKGTVQLKNLRDVLAQECQE